MAKTGDLYKVDCHHWAAVFSGLKEVRDQREVQVLSRILTDLNHSRLPKAVDLSLIHI